MVPGYNLDNYFGGGDKTVQGGGLVGHAKCHFDTRGHGIYFQP